MGAAVGDVVAGRLALADRQGAPVRSRRLQHPQRHQVDVGDRKRPGARRRGRQLGGRLEAAEVVGLGEDRAGGARARRREPVGVGRAAGVRHLDDLHAEPGGERAHHLAHLRVERLGHHHPRAPGRLLGHVAGVRRHRGAVVPGGVGDVHAGQLADGGLVLEDRLQRALAHLRLVGRVGGQELAPPHHRVHHGRARSGHRRRRRGRRARCRCPSCAPRARTGAPTAPPRSARARARAAGPGARRPGCR